MTHNRTPDPDWMTAHDWHNGVVTFGRAYPHIGTVAGCRAAIAGNLPYVGHGISRNAYRDAQDWCYKVLRPGFTDDTAQTTEYVAMLILRRERFPFVGPINLWNVDGNTIVTMPYYPRPVEDSWRAMRQVRDLIAHGTLHDYIDGWAADDLHPGNFRLTASGRLRIIDLGSFQW